MEIIIAAILAFASTNIDDVFILLVFFASKDAVPRQIVVGQYLGIAALIALSLAGSLAGLLIAPAYIGLLRLLPIVLGIRQLLQRRSVNEQQRKPMNTSQGNKTFLVASVTIANGSDNIGIYIPFFATLTVMEKAVVVGIFLLMTAVWCALAFYSSKHPAVARTLDKGGHTVMPIVLILLGVYILFESGSVQLLVVMVS